MKIYIGKHHCCDLTYTYHLLYSKLRKIGEIVEDVQEADYIVFPGSCCGSLEIIKIVIADILRVLKNKKNNAITFITGCMTNEIVNPELRVLVDKFLYSNFDYVIPEKEFTEIINIIAQKEVVKNSFGACIGGGNIVDIYIARGCANKCSFCKMNYLNMPTRSVAFEEIEKCINSLPEEISTVRLKANNAAQYGLDFGYEHNLIDIIKLIENRESIEKVEIYGLAFKDAIINEFAQGLKTKKVRLISGSIETGSPRLLSMMDKGYKIPDLLSFMSEVNELYPKELSTDIIVGFPTETYEDIELTIKLIDILRPKDLFIRTYQNSPYIPSGKYDQLTNEEINEHYNIYVKELKLRGCI